MRLFSTLGVVTLAMLLSAFSWGDRAQEEKKPSAPTYDYSANSSTPPVTSTATTSQYATKKVAAVENRVQQASGETVKKAESVSQSWENKYENQSADPKAVAQTAQTAAVSGASGFPSELITSLAEGDEATRRARIESLKRLSQALAQVRAQQTVTTPVAEDSKKSKNR